MVYRHSLVVRVTHATFAISFFALAVSGAQMYFKQHWFALNVAALHQYFGLAMLASGLTYAAYAIASGDLRNVLFGPRDIPGVLPMIAYYLRLRATAPAYDGYNPLQKMAYTAVLFTLGPLMAASGLALWKHAPLLHPLSVLFGGKAANVWHVGFAIELVLFFAGHMVMIATTGLRNNLRAIVTGWYLHGETEQAEAVPINLHRGARVTPD